MASTHVLTFVVLTIIGILLLLTASITASIGATDAGKSTYYHTFSQVSQAHQLLVTTSALGWAGLAILVIVILIAVIADGFPSLTLSKEMLAKQTYDTQELQKAVKAEHQLTSGKSIQLTVFIVFIVVTIFAFVVGVLAASASGIIGSLLNSGKLPNIPLFTDPIYPAHGEAIASSVTAFLAFGCLTAATVMYYHIRKNRQSEADQLQTIITRTQEKSGGTIQIVKTPEPEIQSL